MNMFTTGVKERFFFPALLLLTSSTFDALNITFLMIILFEIVPENGAKELCIVTKLKGDVMCLAEC